MSRSRRSVLIAGGRDTEPVKGFTHGFYIYPARFSPAFVRAAIETFTHPSDMVLDNHVGGGATPVEALATGRLTSLIRLSYLAPDIVRLHRSGIEWETYGFPDMQSLDGLKRWVANRIVERSDRYRWRDGHIMPVLRSLIFRGN